MQHLAAIWGAIDFQDQYEEDQYHSYICDGTPKIIASTNVQGQVIYVYATQKHDESYYSTKAKYSCHYNSKNLEIVVGQHAIFFVTGLVDKVG